MISIVVPAYGEEQNISRLYDEITGALSGSGRSFEIIIVDDGSRDRTFDEIALLAERDPGVKGIRLSRNFGHQIALMAGFGEAGGDRVVMMDADGQHPASMIIPMVEKLEEGYDIVNMVQQENRGAGLFKRFSSKLFYSVFNAFSDVSIESGSSEFRIMTREAVKAFLSMEEHNRFTRGMISWMGFRQASLPYVAPERRSGRSKYSIRHMITLAFDGLTAFSSKPLRISTYLGMIVLLLGIVYAIYTLVIYLLGRSNPGWASLMITILVLGGTQLMILGIVGEYLSRIFTESKKRPHYFIERRTGQSDPS